MTFEAKPSGRSIIQSNIEHVLKICLGNDISECFNCPLHHYDECQKILFENIIERIRKADSRIIKQSEEINELHIIKDKYNHLCESINTIKELIEDDQE